MTDKLTTKQRLFVEAYLVNPNATDAARKAGYTGNENTLNQTAAKLVRNGKISGLINQRVEAAIITANEVLSDVKSIAKTAERDADRLKGYEMLGKYLKLWTDRTELTGKDGEPLSFNIEIK